MSAIICEKKEIKCMYLTQKSCLINRFVFRNFIQKAELFRSILSNATDEISTECIISLGCNLLDLFQGDASSHVVWW